MKIQKVMNEIMHAIARWWDEISSRLKKLPFTDLKKTNIYTYLHKHTKKKTLRNIESSL